MGTEHNNQSVENLYHINIFILLCTFPLCVGSCQASLTLSVLYTGQEQIIMLNCIVYNFTVVSRMLSHIWMWPTYESYQLM
jgi:hypothetical protein